MPDSSQFSTDRTYAGQWTIGRNTDHRSYRTLASFRDPDGNGWLL
jgi:hypothetical protein